MDIEFINYLARVISAGNGYIYLCPANNFRVLINDLVRMFGPKYKINVRATSNFAEVYNSQTQPPRYTQWYRWNLTGGVELDSDEFLTSRRPNFVPDYFIIQESANISDTSLKQLYQRFPRTQFKLFTQK